MEASPDSFSLHDHEEEEEVDENEINRKIEELMKNMTLKQAEVEEDRKK